VIEMSKREAIAIVAAALAPAVAVVGTCAQKGLFEPRPVGAGTTVVHAEKSGVTFDTQALSGRVALVASSTGVRWRILGVTVWNETAGRVLTKSWDTSKVADGRYYLQLEHGRNANTQSLFVRNYTYLNPTTEATDFVGLDKRSTDGRAVAAVFARRSYRPGDRAILEFWHRYGVVTIDILHVGPENAVTVGNDTMGGAAVAGPFNVAGSHGSASIRIGEWESGVYTARMTCGSKVGFAPFIVRPRRLGTQPVAVVEPTNTWQAYNYRDADGDGKPDTWYFWWGRRPWVNVQRPFLDCGVPPKFRRNDATFLRWLAHTGRKVDMLSQDDLEHVSGDRLAKLYRLVIFPGHHEYVTEGEYNAIERYRNLGGHLIFLAANNFFWRVNHVGHRLNRIALWRDIGRPESALVGVEYFTWNQNKFGSMPYEVGGAGGAPWIFAGTGIDNSSHFGYFGVEADRVTPHSPKSLRVLATIPHVFNSKHSAAMTYYETASGAKVFAAGAFTLAGPHLRCRSVSQLLANLWDNLAGEPTEDRYAQASLGACPY